MKGWKTVLVGVLQLAIYIFAWPELTEYLSPQVIAAIAATLTIVLRFLTNSPVFKNR